MPGPDQPLRVALLAYRGKPHCGGQGVYVRHLSAALADLGHHVEVLGGQPWPELDPRVPLVKLRSLDIYNDHFPMRMPGVWELKDAADLFEVTAFSVGQFPEPLAFSVRAWQHLRGRRHDFDLVHDNQSLGYGLLAIQAMGLPVLATIHHPITVDRRLEMAAARTRYRKLTLHRWYSFTTMQTRVARRLPRVVTVSESSLDDISRDHRVPPERLHVVPVGVDTTSFRPLDHVARVPGRLMTTASADVAMKGLRFLLEALAKVRTEREDAHLVVIGKPREATETMATIERLGLGGVVEFVSGVPEERIVELYAEAELAVVPSLYEGFSLPAVEAMACAVPLVATTGGALPEVAGRDRETAFLVPPGDAGAIATTILAALADPDLRAGVGAAGRERVAERWSWRATAEATVEQYRALLEDAGRC
ncbi:MAG TPA: glycosyltransferase family 4 protein [Acidimicrobiales bacterium]|jgi:glycosyltransferase involved in cell wall biosynthesis